MFSRAKVDPIPKCEREKKNEASKIKMESNSRAGNTWPAATNTIIPTRNIALLRTSRRRNTSSAAAEVKPQEGHCSDIRSDPQSRHRVIPEARPPGAFRAALSHSPREKQMIYPSRSRLDSVYFAIQQKNRLNGEARKERRPSQSGGDNSMNIP